MGERMDYTLTRLLGGIANGKDVPGDWEVISEWEEPGTGQKSVYEKRHFYDGGDRLNVWVAVDVPEPDFQAIMRWHREMYRGDLVAAQKDMLHESMAAATNYTNVIMVAGYAALFALWAQMSGQGVGKFTPATSFAAAICMSLSVLAFIGWEVFGMTLRSTVNLSIAKAVNDPSRFEEHMRSYREHMGSIARRFQHAWIIVVSVAAGFALLAFAIMLSGLLHGAWLALHR
jgi:hypothetical protein